MVRKSQNHNRENTRVYNFFSKNFVATLLLVVVTARYAWVARAPVLRRGRAGPRPAAEGRSGGADEDNANGGCIGDGGG